MTVTQTDGTQGPPDWSCYGADAAYLVRPHLLMPHAIQPLADDGGTDDAAVDSADSGTGEDAATPPDDASASQDTGAPTTTVDAGRYTLNLIDFGTMQPNPGASVDILWGGSIVGDASFTGTIDDAGNVYYPTPPQGVLQLSYRVSGPGQAYVAWAGEVIVPPPGAITSNSVSNSTEKLLLGSILGSQEYDTTKAILVAGAKDCQFRDVNGGVFTVLDSTGTPVTSGTASGTPRAVYLYNGIPNDSCTYGTNSGRAVWAMVNAPVTNASPASPRTADYTLQFSGRMSASDAAPVVIATEAIEAFPDAISVDRPCRLSVPSN
jgi:hypothetical protein